MEEKERAGPVGHGGPAGTEAVETPHGARRLAVYQRWWRVYDLMWERENPTRAVRSNTNLRTSGSDPTQLATAGSGTTRDREMAADLTTARLRLNEWLSQLSHQPKEQAAQHNPNYNFLSKQRAQLWDLMDDSSSSPAAMVVAVLVMLTIALSSLALILETVESVDVSTSVWDTVELVCVIIFSVEIVLRIISTPSLLLFAKDIMNIIDFLAIAPYYIEIAFEMGRGGGSPALRSLRLIRVFRIFKVSRYVSWIQLFSSVMAQSWQPLMMLFFIMALAVVFFSSALYFIERGDYHEESRTYFRSDGSPSPFQSIPATFHWCVITLTTVGYGDDFPVTPLGRLVASFTCMFGILVLAIPVSVISQNFTSEYVKERRLKQLTRRHIANIRQCMSRATNGSAGGGSVASLLSPHRLARHGQAEHVANVAATVLDESGMLQDRRSAKHALRELLQQRVDTILDESYDSLLDGMRSMLHRERKDFRAKFHGLIEDQMDGALAEAAQFGVPADDDDLDYSTSSFFDNTYEYSVVSRESFLD